MGASQPTEELDLDSLERALKALANDVRLRLLAKLTDPKRLSEIEIHTDASYGDLPSSRPLSRSTVQEHVAKLEDEDLVRRVPDDNRVAVDQQQVYALVRELGVLTRLEPLVDVDVDQTMELTEPEADESVEGPQLVVVNGPRTGTVYPLEDQGPWRIGRDPTLDVDLSYDPHASSVHAKITRAEDGLFEVEALPGTTNPTALDFSELAPGQPEPLMPGSVLSIGASRLVFKAV
jgi:DNA-binding transcriptional ArsR family regulator